MPHLPSVDQIQLRFDEGSLALLNVILGLIMFGVALDLRIEDFRRVARSPKGPAVGLVAQFILFPAATYLFTRVLDPAPSLALGMILVAACPGGNISNFLTHLSRGNTPLSISMTAVSTVAAVVMTPLNIALWGSLNPKTAPILHQVALEPLSLFGTVVTILGLPLAAGMLLAAKRPTWAARLRGPLKKFSIAFFVAFVALALRANFDHFLNYIGLVAFAVFLHNGMALSLGYVAARALRLPEADARAISIEVGIQNSGLGLALIFAFFGGLGGMAIVAAWWGIWHVIAGLSLAFFWSRRSPAPETVPAPAVAVEAAP